MVLVFEPDNDIDDYTMVKASAENDRKTQNKTAEKYKINSKVGSDKHVLHFE
jgi:hypothetical protein